MDANKLISASLTLCLLASAACAQSSGTTVRHRRVTQESSGTSPLVLEAEAALEKQDWVTAEARLKSATAASPNDYQAWYYLGYVYAQTQRPDDAVDAYRRSIA